MTAKRTLPLAGVVLLAAVSVLGQSAPQSAKKSGARSKPAPSATVARGEKVYDTQCEVCHFDHSTKKKIGPGLKGLMARGKFSDGKKVDDESLRAWIEKGGKDMPEFKDSLNDAEMRDLIAYLKTL
jgi:mono/diheme cytochrome c family protein